MSLLNSIPKVFIVEDDRTYSKIIEITLEKEQKLDLHFFTNGADFIAQLDQKPDIVILDYNLPDFNGLDLLKKVQLDLKEVQTIILSGQEDVTVVVNAYRNGAKDYIIKSPSALTELCSSVRQMCEHVRLKKEVEDLKSRIYDRERYQQILGDSKAILQVMRLMQKIEGKDVMALVTGESGTGKELISKSIHLNSPRKRGPFVALNMGAIPEDLAESELFGHEKGAFTGANSRRYGAFEEAEGGTIFLDEIGEINLSLQVKLLRVLQEHKVSRVGSSKEIPFNVRVIAATNKNLLDLVKAGKFREDLYYRLQGFPIHLPPLRDRDNDVIVLGKYFLEEFCKANRIYNKSFSKQAIQLMLNYTWPGNIRELKSVVERAVLMNETDQIIEEDLMFTQQPVF